MTKISINRPVISITRADSKIFENLAEQYLKTPTEKLKLQMLDIFDPQLKSQAEYFAKKQGISSQDYLQKLYLKFFKYLETVIKRKYPAAIMSYRLGGVKPSKDDIISFHYPPIEQSKLFYTLDDPILTEQKRENFNPEEIWQTVQKHTPPLNVAAELEDIMATQTGYASVFRNRQLATRVQNFLKKDPDFKFKIELPKRCNNNRFKNKVKKMSVETFGKNIFEFLN